VLFKKRVLRDGFIKSGTYPVNIHTIFGLIEHHEFMKPTEEEKMAIKDSLPHLMKSLMKNGEVTEVEIDKYGIPKSL